MHGFLPSTIEPEHWILGSGKARKRFGGASLMPNGHGWGAYKPAPEVQNNGRVETMACTVYGSLNCWETLANFLGYADFPTDCSDRFNAILAGITPEGGDPQRSCEAIRNFGVIPQALLPFGFDIASWAQYYSPIPLPSDLVLAAKKLADTFLLGHEWVFLEGSADKPGKLKAALARGPVAVSMYAWKFDSARQLYFKDKTDIDDHWVQILDYVDGQYWIAWDDYEQFEKHIAWDTDFGCAKVYFMSRRADTPSLLEKLQRQVIYLMTQLLASLRAPQAATAPPTVPATVPESDLPPNPPPMPKPAMLDTFCTALRDFEGKPGDLNYKNNNPGNFRCSPVGYLAKYGAVKCVGNFAVFPSYELGWEYLQASVLHWATLHPTWTIFDFFSHYAPPSDNNPTLTYASNVAGKCGVPVSTTLQNLFA